MSQSGLRAGPILSARLTMQIHRRRAWGACALGIVVLAVGPRDAQAVAGVGVLDASSSASRLLHVTCFDDGSGAPASLAGHVEDLGPLGGAFVSLQITKGGAATNCTDPTDADGSPGPRVWINGGAGDYDVFVDKSEAGEESYRVTLECMTGLDGGGAVTGTTLTGLPGPAGVPALAAAARALLALSLSIAAGLLARPRAGRRTRTTGDRR